DSPRVSRHQICVLRRKSLMSCRLRASSRRELLGVRMSAHDPTATSPHFACRKMSVRDIGFSLTARSVFAGCHDMNRPMPKPLRRRSFVALGHAIHVTWPVLSVMIAIQLALGLLTGFVEGWSVGDSVYFTFITGLTIGYGDLVPKQTLTRALTIVIGYFGLFVTGVIAAIAVYAMRSALIDGGSGGERSNIDEMIE